MKPWIFYIAVTLSWILADVSDAISRMGRRLYALLGKVFGLSGTRVVHGLSRIPFTKRRLNYLARLARVEFSAARDLGVSAKELLREGHPVTARRAARVAFHHWRKARNAFDRIRAVA